MAKFFGKIGFSVTSEYDPINHPGVWKESITERDYYGDIIRVSRRWENGEHLNDNLNINNEISIVSDAYAIQNFCMMKYIVWMGIKWKITSVSVEHPRLTLSIGGVYNGEPNRT